MTPKEIPTHVVLVEAWIYGNKGEFLIAKRSSQDDQNASAWSMPGGKVEKVIEDNIVEKTLEREILEEVGLCVEKPRLFSTRSFTRNSGDTVIQLSFLVDYVSGKDQPLDDQDEVKWVSLEDLPEYLHEDFWQNSLENLGKVL